MTSSKAAHSLVQSRTSGHPNIYIYIYMIMFDVCYVIIYVGIRGNICNVLPVVLQNVPVKRNNVLLFVILFKVFVFKHIYIWMYLYLPRWKVFVFKYLTKYLIPWLPRCDQLNKALTYSLTYQPCLGCSDFCRCLYVSLYVNQWAHRIDATSRQYQLGVWLKNYLYECTFFLMLKNMPINQSLILSASNITGRQDLQNDNSCHLSNTLSIRQMAPMAFLNAKHQLSNV